MDEILAKLENYRSTLVLEEWVRIGNVVIGDCMRIVRSHQPAPDAATIRTVLQNTIYWAKGAVDADTLDQAQICAQNAANHAGNLLAALHQPMPDAGMMVQQANLQKRLSDQAALFGVNLAPHVAFSLAGIAIQQPAPKETGDE